MDLFCYLVFFLFCIPVLLFFSLFCVSWLTVWPRRNKNFFFKEHFYYHPSGVSKTTFPNILLTETTSWEGPQHTSPEIYLTVVIPAMNEKDRLPVMLDECIEYLNKRQTNDKNFSYEIIVVDDGSTDNTSDIAYEYNKIAPVFVCKLPQNIGKGGAVRVGVLCARGQLILFADADGATKFSDFQKLERKLHLICNGEAERNEPIDWTHPALVVGSRAHLEKESIAKRSFVRTILMVGFHLIVKFFAVRTVNDTQCGFKLFSRAAAAKLFPQIHIERWAFDVELLYIAESLNFSISEIAVEWTEIEGSKITPIFSWIQMGRDIILIWFRYSLKIWQINDIKI